MHFRIPFLPTPFFVHISRGHYDDLAHAFPLLFKSLKAVQCVAATRPVRPRPSTKILLYFCC